LTVSLRGGFEQQAHCQLFQFTGQLDAYSDKQFSDFISSHCSVTPQPLVIDLSRIDFLDSSGLGALVQLAKDLRLEEFLHLQSDLDSALDQFAA
jgi:anti-sigma B factor antagonist